MSNQSCSSSSSSSDIQTEISMDSFHSPPSYPPYLFICQLLFLSVCQPPCLSGVTVSEQAGGSPPEKTEVQRSANISTTALKDRARFDLSHTLGRLTSRGVKNQARIKISHKHTNVCMYTLSCYLWENSFPGERERERWRELERRWLKDLNLH